MAFPSLLFKIPDCLFQHVFINPGEHELECLEQCLLQRMQFGQGECFLEIGVGGYSFIRSEGQDPGLSPADIAASVITAEALAKKLDARLILLRDRYIQPTVKQQQHLQDGMKNSNEATNPPQHKGRKRQKNQCHKESAAADQSPTENEVTEEMSVAGSDGWVVKEFLLRRNCEARDFVEVRVAVVGNVDAGKSTMLGVLTHGELDNGRGLARLRIFRHKHEFESGRTSSVSNDILGFDADGVVVNKPVRGKLDWSEICQKATKVRLRVHFRRTLLLAAVCAYFVMLMVGANAGIIGMTKEHLGLALALSVPVFVVITKVDMCPPNVLNETINLLFRILKSPGCRKIPSHKKMSSLQNEGCYAPGSLNDPPVNHVTHVAFPILVIFVDLDFPKFKPHSPSCIGKIDRDDVICSAINFTSERMCPVFLVSNVTGSNLDLLTSFLNLLSPRSPSRLEDPAEFQIDELFKVPGVGCVVSGTCLGGIIRVNDVLLLGPDSDGLFIPVPVKSIQRKRLTVNEVHGGQAASIALKRPRVIELRRGMILAARSLQAYGCMEFQATVLILHHPTTISVGYQAMVHAGPVRQTAKILVIIGKERLRTGDKAEVRFQFIRRPEYLRKGVRLVFREGKTKAVGTVTETVPYQLVFPARVSRASQPLPTDQSTASSQPRPAYAVAAADHQSESAAASPLPTAPTTTPRTPAHLSVTTAIATATATNT
ncbi:unnamed protein product [Schistocephalus solidus]|uniref:Tr-type G domain-containing protein n=1 Tax=Schistocephalus solidus TaxID=70667 RepID=A0A3P7CSP5_SCHSO|nr:unnamed protein product [Schistocephalus solidus]